jgi:acetylglutamate kinase
MNRKMIEAVEAVEGGVREILIANGLLENPVKKALENPGTRIVRNP